MNIIVKPEVSLKILFVFNLFAVLCVLLIPISSLATDQPHDDMKRVYSSVNRDLWYAALRHSDSSEKNFREALETAYKSRDNDSIIHASIALALVIAAKRDNEKSDLEGQCLKLIESAIELSSGAAQVRVRFIRALLMAHFGHLSKAQQEISNLEIASNQNLENLRLHLAKMLASWDMVNERSKKITVGLTTLSPISYPLKIVPDNSEWEIVSIAYFIVTAHRYGNFWSPLFYDVLEKNIENQLFKNISAKFKSNGILDDSTWETMFNLSNFYDAHRRPSDAIKIISSSKLPPSLLQRHELEIRLIITRAELRKGNFNEAKLQYSEARRFIHEKYDDPDIRFREEDNLASSLVTSENRDLAISAYELLDLTANQILDRGRQFAARLKVAHVLMALHGEAGNLREISNVYSNAKKVANVLDSSPDISRGTRFSLEQLTLAEIRGLLMIPSRRNEAREKMVALLEQMDKVANVTSRPAEDVLKAIEEAKEAGRASSIENYLRRQAATDVQEKAFPILAKLYMHSAEWNKAKNELIRSLLISFRRYGICGREEQLSFWQDLALVAEATGKISDAENWVNEWANCSAAKNRNSRELATALISKGRLLAQRGDFYGAEYMLKRALNILNSQTFVGDLIMADALASLGELMKDQQRIEEAKIYTLQLAGILEKSTSSDIKWQLLATRGLNLLYEFAATHSSDSPNDAAFLLVQHGNISEAAAGLEAFVNRASLRSLDLAELVQQRQDLQRRRERLDVKFEQVFGSNATAENVTERLAVTRQIDDVNKKLQEKAGQIDVFQSYSNLVSGRTISLREFTSPVRNSWILAETEALVTFRQAKDYLYVQVVRRSGATPIKISLSHSDASSLVASIRSTLEVGSDVQGKAIVKEFNYYDSARLYEKVWSPLSNALRNVTHIVAVVDGPLQSLPLEVLARKKDNTQPISENNSNWLDEEYSITYLPSVSALKSLRLDVLPSKASKPIVVFGPPDLSNVSKIADTDRLSFSKYFSMGSELRRSVCSGQVPPLPADTISLSRSLSQAFNGSSRDSYIGRNMKKETFEKLNMQRELANYRVLSFVTHGLISGELMAGDFAEPALVMTPPINCTSDAEQMSLLTASDISILKLDAEWVLLLACNTASADGILGAKPLSGLARAFLFAGARALLVSHWSVDAIATVNFVQLMLEGPPTLKRSDQLRNARSKMRAAKNEAGVLYIHPIFWAGFVLIGDGR